MAISMALDEGLDYILSHFGGQRLWPRTVSTKATEGRQVVVNGREEALTRFAQASFLDCRISAYPVSSELSSFVGVNLDIAPSIVMIDLDRETFKTQKAFEMALARTLNRINSNLCSCEPTIIWSGRGYHIYLVLDAFVLESIEIFNNNRFGSNPSKKFLRFAEELLSNGKCDPQHNNTVSLRNCMLRIPGSVNSKNGQTVRIIQKSNGYRPSIKLLLEDFYVNLCNQRIGELEQKKKLQFRKRQSRMQFSDIHDNIQWIERLLRTPISNYRKLVIWRVFVPYLLNVRGFSPEVAHTVIREWLEECDRLRRLDFAPSNRIKRALNNSRDFLPISCDKLKMENEGFYHLLQDNGVFTT